MTTATRRWTGECEQCGATTSAKTNTLCSRCSHARRRSSTVRRAVDHPPPTPQPTPCRIWQGALRGKYGHKPSVGQVHRWVVRTVGEDQFGTPWNDDLLVMHLCDNRLCFRYDHLRLGTVQDNNADRDAKGRTVVVMPAARAAGERSGRAKLTWEQVQEIRRRLDAGEVGRRLADEFGLNSGTITRIKQRKIWPYENPPADWRTNVDDQQ